MSVERRSSYLLTHSADLEAQAVARNLLGDDLQPVDYTAMPFAVFSSPEVVGVGATKQELRAADREYAKRACQYEAAARDKAMNAEGFVNPLIEFEQVEDIPARFAARAVTSGFESP